MNRSIAVPILFGALCCLMATAHAAPRITIGPHPNLSLTGLTTLDIFYDTSTGGGLMQGQTLNISIADEGNGGLGNADPGEPKIVNIDAATGTNWAGNMSPGHPYYNALGDQFWWIDQVTFISSPVTVNASGKAFSITIDPNGAPANSIWGLRVFVMVPDLGGPYPSTWAVPTPPYGFSFEFGDPIQFGTTPSGSFQYVPEPSTLALATLGFFSLTAAVWRKRRLARFP